MNKARYILFWCLVAVVGLFVQFIVTKWATETEKDPDLAETVVFEPARYPEIAARFTPEGLKAHIDALSGIPSRQTGTPGCDAALEYIRAQFRALGVGEPVVQEFPATVPVHDIAEARTPQGVFPLHPLHPNGVCPAATPKEGIKTRLIYAGSGSLAEVEGKELDGATAVVETGAREQWLYLIDLGARAIIFVERERPPRYIGMTTQTMSHQDVPRFWMTQAEGAPLVALLKSRDLEATLYSDARWERRTGKNIYVDIPGLSTKEHNKDEVVVLSAYYDSSSFVPDLAPGAEQACGIAALLELGKLIAEHRFQKSVRLLALSGHFQAIEGARRYAWDNVARHTSPMRDVSPQGHAAFFGLDLSSGGPRVGLFYAGNFFTPFENNVKPRVSDLGRRATHYANEIATALGVSPDELFVDTINPAFGKEWFTYAPTGLALDHEAALIAGVPSLSFVTVNDSRFFAATPNDTEVNAENLARQVRLLACLLPNAFNVEGRYLKRSMQRVACRVRGRVVSFDPKEGYLPNKPVPNAVVTARGMWDQMILTGVMARPVTLANGQGEFELPCLGYNAEALYQMGWLAFEPFVIEDGHITWAPDFGQMGRESYPLRLLPVQKEMESMCVAFPCKTLDLFNLVDPRNYNLLNSLDVLEAASNSPPAVYGTTLQESACPSFMAPTASIFTQPGKRLKITAGAGAAQKRMLLLNVPERFAPGQLFNTGDGFAVDDTPAVRHTYMQSATDMYRLDESRIAFFGSHGIKNARVNTLHRLAGDALEKARKALDARNYQEYFVQAKRALGFESRAYPDVVGMANDVVRGLVFYLVLLIPFAFATERLFFAGRRIETRIAGIVALFLAMFFVLRFTHPAFRIVLSPMIVLLGFAVATLSVVIISIVMAKLEALVSKRKIEQQGEHESGVQAVSGFALALELGIANMRRRRARTILTSITLIVLTFSVLSFMSVTAQLRIQQYTYSDGATPYQGALLRTRNWAPFPFETYASLRNEYGGECTIAPRRWYYGALVLNRSFIDIDKDGVIRSVSALAGLSAEELKFFDIKGALLGNSRWIGPHVEGVTPPEEILLPVNLARDFLNEPGSDPQAALSPAEKERIANAMIGRKVRMLGREFEVIGVYDWEKMNELVDIDGERLTPFDPVEMEKKFQEEGTPDPESVQRYIHHSFKDVAIVSEQVLGNLGGDLRSVALLPHDPGELTPLLENLIRRLDYILFANLDGTPTLLSSRNATRISELWNLLILMVIAGLIVFNTMLGSVFERTKEIGTYTALGIAPSHIGRLFMVEAGVFAVLGVMAGYVAGQTVSRLAHVLDIPLLNTLELNYSSMAGVAACLLVMGMVLLSSVYPSRKASELGVPDIERRWKLPPTKEARITLQLPFTVSMHEAPGLVAFLKEYLDSHVDVSVGNFYVEEVQAGPAIAGGSGTGITARFWLTPFDLGISQYTTIALRVLEDMNVCGVEVSIERLSGDASSWRRANGHFMTAIRSQFLVWRNLTPQARADYVSRGKEFALA